MVGEHLTTSIFLGWEDLFNKKIHSFSSFSCVSILYMVSKQGECYETQKIKFL
jgi:hypothetical protein